MRKLRRPKLGEVLFRSASIMRTLISEMLERIAHTFYRNEMLAFASTFLSLSSVVFPYPARSLTLAVFLKKQGKRDSAKKALLKARDLYCDQVPSEVANELVTMLIEDGEYEQACDEMEKFLEKNPENSSMIYHLASIRAYQRNFGEAQRLLTKDVPVSTGNGNVTYTRIVNFFWLKREVERVDVMPFHSPCRKMSSQEWETVYFVASDSSYFCRFAIPLISSFKNSAQHKVFVHFHIVNCDTAAEAIVSELEQHEDFVGFSRESTDLSQLNTEQRKVYYSCARYLHLPGILDIVNVPVIVADIDQMVIAPIGPYVSFVNGHDVSFLLFKGHKNNLLSLISATLVSFSKSENARSFAISMQNYLRCALQSPDNLSWHLDQAALVVCYLSLEGIDYGFVPKEMIHLTDDEPNELRQAKNPIFWSITSSISENAKKTETVTFQQLAGK